MSKGNNPYSLFLTNAPYFDQNSRPPGYRVEIFHCPTGTKCLNGRPGTPCSKITISNSYIHNCSGAAYAILGAGSTTVISSRLANNARVSV